jgi:hypothetical protein
MDCNCLNVKYFQYKKRLNIFEYQIIYKELCLDCGKFITYPISEQVDLIALQAFSNKKLTKEELLIVSTHRN